MDEYVDIEFKLFNKILLLEEFKLLNKSDRDLGSWFVYVNKVFWVLLF